ncbi:hypothetical protein, partial [Sphingobacterium sp. IITKGP-BTPF85]|uniref:hypothetical protein n=1 Tax=Sphingobacterium sp. IITKGP-BTPF85 TaxID=1338009 RepID=UPI000563B54A
AKSKSNETYRRIDFDYELKKRGRAYFWIIMHVDKQKDPQLAIDFTKTLDYQKCTLCYGLWTK